ncbi:MAG: hypothetical protein JXQ73_07015 [Phycisphaerae bacterium]|nr:hypothetical protein [Phycisphaerae bacterium]
MLRYAMLAVVVMAVMPGVVLGDYYDDFSDHHYWQDPNDEPFSASQGYWPLWNTPPYDPNLWDIDNPHWLLYGLIGRNFDAEADDGWLRLYAELDFLPYCVMYATVNDGDLDPNTSTTFYDDSAPHYIVGRMKVYDPNYGEVFLMVHADPISWGAYAADFECDDENFTAAWLEGASWSGKTPIVRSDINEGTGFWMVCQIDGDGDPNHTRIKASAWNGGKFDWDGVWERDDNILATWDPNKHGYWGSGICAIGTLASDEAGGSLDSDAKFDEIEVRWGTFTNVSCALDLNVVNTNYGTVTINPDLRNDPNDDPNDWSHQRRYTQGTEVVLVAEPIEGKSFNRWLIFDPNYPGDANHATPDSNTVLYLTMDVDKSVEAAFKCGTGAPPFMAMSLLALGLGVVIRRLT